MKSIALGVALMFSVSAMGKCMVKYVRTACPGQEKISYKKCGGQKSCVKKKRAKSLEACQKAALKSCRNSRLDITKMKVITATWKGAAIKSASGKTDFCKDYANRSTEFNKCK